MGTDIDFNPLEEGDAVTDTSINSRFTALQNGINGLTEYALADKAFGISHMPSFAGTLIGTTKFNGNHDALDTGLGENWYPAGLGILTLSLSSTALGEGNGSNVTAVLVLANIGFERSYDPGSAAATYDQSWGFYSLEIWSGAAWVRVPTRP